MGKPNPAHAGIAYARTPLHAAGMLLKWRELTCLVALVCMLGVVGCSTPKGLSTDSGAAVLVTNQPPLEIAKAISEVFKQAGFTSVGVPANTRRSEYKLVFERPASTGDTLLYGDWSLKRNWFRARVRIMRDTEPRRSLVTCDAFRVINRGDGHFEDEKKLSRAGHGSYQKLLDEAVAKLPSVPIERAPTF